MNLKQKVKIDEFLSPIDRSFKVPFTPVDCVKQKVKIDEFLSPIDRSFKVPFTPVDCVIAKVNGPSSIKTISR
jgi:hypothetical protein